MWEKDCLTRKELERSQQSSWNFSRVAPCCSCFNRKQVAKAGKLEYVGVNLRVFASIWMGTCLETLAYSCKKTVSWSTSVTKNHPKHVKSGHSSQEGTVGCQHGCPRWLLGPQMQWRPGRRADGKCGDHKNRLGKSDRMGIYREEHGDKDLCTLLPILAFALFLAYRNKTP